MNDIEILRDQVTNLINSGQLAKLMCEYNINPLDYITEEYITRMDLFKNTFIEMKINFVSRTTDTFNGKIHNLMSLHIDPTEKGIGHKYKIELNCHCKNKYGEECGNFLLCGSEESSGKKYFDIIQHILEKHLDWIQHNHPQEDRAMRQQEQDDFTTTTISADGIKTHILRKLV